MSILKIHSDRWDPARGWQVGRLWHFGHFMHDFLIPMNDWRLTHQPDLSKTTLYLCDTPDQTVGSFRGIVEEFLQTKLKLVSPEEFRETPGQELTLRAYLFGPYTRQTCANMLATARQRYGLDQKQEPAFNVILVERGTAELGFENDSTIKGWLKANGSQRRFILNHGDVADFLSNRYGERFCNVVLEELSFEEQVRLFNGARLVLGQHGAGLNHLLWMDRPDAALVELGKPLTPPFVNMCKVKPLRYVNLQGMEAPVKPTKRKTKPQGPTPRCRAMIVNLQKLETVLNELEGIPAGPGKTHHGTELCYDS